MKMLSLTLASCLLVTSLPPDARADGDRGTRREQQGYAARETRSTVLAEFRGGCMSEEMVWFFLATLPIWIALLPAALLVWGGVSLAEAVCTPSTPKDVPTPGRAPTPAPAPRH
jgi:hypothetical protein